MDSKKLREMRLRPALVATVRAVLRGSRISVAAGAGFFAVTAQAQEQKVEEVIVTGMRQSIESAQEIKRNAEQIVDSVSAVDITALPDRTVTETLQRIPGVAIDHLFAPNDTNRFSAEGSGVVVRGMTQVRSELNGRDVFSARNTRGLSFEDVPSELMAGVDVYKNPSADMVEGGIAGIVDLRTRKPFDSPGTVFGATASANYGDFVEETKPQASALFSTRWDTGVGEMGLLVNAAYSELATRTDSIQFGRPFRRAASEVGTVNGANTNCPSMAGGSFSCVYMPAGARWSELDFDRERIGGAVSFQWRPSDRTLLTVQALHSDYTMNWTEHSAWFQAGGYETGIAPGTTGNFDENGNFVSGRLVTTTNDLSWVSDPLLADTVRILQPGNAHIPTGATTRMAEMHQRTTDVSANFRFDATDNLAFSVDAQYVKATADNHDYTVNTEVWPDAIDVDLSGSLPSVSVVGGGDYLNNPSNYYWAAGMDDTQENHGDERAGRFDVTYQFDSGWVKSLRGGVRATDREANNKDGGYNWQPLTEWWMGNSAGGWPGQLAPLDGYLTDHSRLFTFDNFYRGDANLPGGIWVAGDDLVRDLRKNGELLKQVEINGSGWSPDKFQPSDANDQSEKTYAAYLLLRFGADLGALPLDGNLGLRYVKTDTAASGFAQQPNWTSYPLLDPATAAVGTGESVPVTQEGSYSDVLPSLNVRLKLTPDLQWRIALSKAIARPTFDQLRANVSLGGDVLITYDNSTNPPTPTSQVVTAYTGTGGNPWLKPMRSSQFDTSLEWYFAKQGSLTGTFFYKDVKDYFISGTERQNIFGHDWEVKTTINGDSGTIQGYEIGYSQFYDFLPGILKGLGFQGNYTYVDSKGAPGPTAGNTTPPGLPLEGLSPKSFNAMLMYQRGPVEARLAYNWREQWLLTTQDGDGKGAVWNDDFGQLDASVFFRVNSNVQVGIEANNISNTTQRLLVGPYQYTKASDGSTPAYNVDYIDSRLYRNGWFTFDRRIAATVRVTF
ncbi:MAG: TonB-dependent receptor [Povalibacter sp.]